MVKEWIPVRFSWIAMQRPPKPDPMMTMRGWVRSWACNSGPLLVPVARTSDYYAVERGRVNASPAARVARAAGPRAAGLTLSSLV